MTSEAHKRNPPGSERWGNKVRLVLVTIPEATEIAAAGVGGPKLYETLEKHGADEVFAFYCEADELAKWRAARTSSQAAPAHE